MTQCKGQAKIHHPVFTLVNTPLTWLCVCQWICHLIIFLTFQPIKDKWLPWSINMWYMHAPPFLTQIIFFYFFDFFDFQFLNTDNIFIFFIFIFNFHSYPSSPPPTNLPPPRNHHCLRIRRCNREMLATRRLTSPPPPSSESRTTSNVQMTRSATAPCFIDGRCESPVTPSAVCGRRSVVKLPLPRRFRPLQLALPQSRWEIPDLYLSYPITIHRQVQWPFSLDLSSCHLLR